MARASLAGDETMRAEREYLLCRPKFNRIRDIGSILMNAEPRPARVNWVLVAALSSLGPVLGLASTFGLIGDWTDALSLLAAAICALAICRFEGQRPIRHGALVGLLGGLTGPLVQVILFERYAANNADDAALLRELSPGVDPRWLLQGIGLSVALAGGLALGLLCFLLSRVLRPEQPSRGVDWWVWLVAALVLCEASLVSIPYLRPGIGGLVLWMFGTDTSLWSFIVGAWLLVGVGWSVWRRPFLSRSRAAGFLGLSGVLLTAYSFQGCAYPSSYDDKPSRVQFRLPLDGPILVGWGGADIKTNYHAAYADQRWAYDLMLAKDGKTHAGEGLRLSDYYCYDQPVRAPAEGRVHAVFDGDPEMPIGQLGGGTSAGGNQIILQVGPAEFLFLCHLRPGTILVRPGDRVTAGQELARVGNSGNTSEPHLHVHLQDTPDDCFGEGIPLYFHGYRTSGKFVERGIPRGGYLPETVEHAQTPRAP